MGLRTFSGLTAMALVACGASCGVAWGWTAPPAGAAPAATGAGSILGKALRASTAAGSSSVSMTASLDAPGMGAERVLSLTGSLTYGAAQVGQFTLTIPDQNGNPTTMNEVVDGGTVYVHLKGTWYSESLQQAAGVSGSTSGTPTQILALLDREGAVVTRIGTAKTGGVATTEYRARVDLDAALASNGAGGALGPNGATTKLFDNIAASPTVTADVWVDHQTRLRRMTVVVPWSAAAVKQYLGSDGPSSVTETVTLGLSGYGTPVHVTPPPASEVRPLTSGSTTAPAS